MKTLLAIAACGFCLFGIYRCADAMNEISSVESGTIIQLTYSPASGYPVTTYVQSGTVTIPVTSWVDVEESWGFYVEGLSKRGNLKQRHFYCNQAEWLRLSVGQKYP